LYSRAETVPDRTPPRGAANVPVEERPEGRTIESVDLFRAGREILISHRGDTYRLRRTGTDKLILVK